MKITYRIPTKEPFAFVEVVNEDVRASNVDPENIRVMYETLTAQFKEGDGLDNKQFLSILDELWTTHSISGDPGVIQEMSKSQQEIVRAIKICIKRNEK